MDFEYIEILLINIFRVVQQVQVTIIEQSPLVVSVEVSRHFLRKKKDKIVVDMIHNLFSLKILIYYFKIRLLHPSMALC